MTRELEGILAHHGAADTACERLGSLGIALESGPLVVARFTFPTAGQLIAGWVVPGSSADVAFVYGGIHADEWSAVEVGQRTVMRLRDLTRPPPDLTAVIIPDVRQDGTRERTVGGRDPNRMFTAPGRSVEDLHAWERAEMPDVTVQLQRLREALGPRRILQLHAESDPVRSGIYSDPRAGHESEDRALAARMSLIADRAGAKTRQRGNRPGREQPFEYPDQAAVTGEVGVSAGQNFVEPIRDRAGGIRVPAANVILLETPGKGPVDAGTEADRELDAYVEAILQGFLVR